MWRKKGGDLSTKDLLVNNPNFILGFRRMKNGRRELPIILVSMESLVLVVTQNVALIILPLRLSVLGMRSLRKRKE